MTIQLDLFGEVEATETAATRANTMRLVDGLTCLRDAHPQALEILIGTRRPNTGEIKLGMSGPWAYSVRKNGFHFEDRATIGGWYTRPAHHLTWVELDNLIDNDPRLNDIKTWSKSLTAIDAWRDRYRPHELWPNPESWHPDYIDGDHKRRGWPERQHAWNLVLEILTNLITRLRATTP